MGMITFSSVCGRATAIQTPIASAVTEALITDPGHQGISIHRVGFLASGKMSLNKMSFQMFFKIVRLP